MSIAGSSKKIRGNMDPDPKWQLRGDIVHGKPVYIEIIPNVKKRVKEINSEPVWRKHPTTGEPIKPVYELYVPEDEPVIARAFIQYDLGNGMVLKNYDFEPSQADLDREVAALNPMSPQTMQRVILEQQKQIQQLLDFVNGQIPGLEVEMNQQEDPEAYEPRVPSLEDFDVEIDI